MPIRQTERQEEEHERQAVAEVAAQVGADRKQAGGSGHRPHDVTEESTGPISLPERAVIN